jgi:DNA-directed RNA polymerase specialized sigma24 family protein
MDNRTPLSMPEAHAVWLHRLPGLYGETVNYLRKAPLTRLTRKAKSQTQEAVPQEHERAPLCELNLSLARATLVMDEGLHEDIVQELGIRFFRNVARGKVWAGTQIVKDRRTKKDKEVTYVDCWLNRVHKRVARACACAEAREHLHRKSFQWSGGAGDEIPLLPGLDEASGKPSPEQITSVREILSALSRRLTLLVEREREIFFRYLDGDSYLEIATDLGMAEQTARSSVHRTRKKLLLEAEGTGHQWPLFSRKNALHHIPPSLVLEALPLRVPLMRVPTGS